MKIEVQAVLSEARDLLSRCSPRPWKRHGDYVTAPKAPLDAWQKKNPNFYRGEHLVCESLGIGENQADGDLIAWAPTLIEALCILLEKEASR